MRADPNGAVDLSEAIGREGEVDRLWALLTRQNVVLSGRRGVGKSTVARLVLSDAPTGWRGRRVSLGGLSGAAALGTAMLEALRSDAESDAGQSLQAAIAPILGKPAPKAREDDDPDGLTRSAIENELDDRNIGLVLVLDEFDDYLARTTKQGGSTKGLGKLFDNLATLTGPGTRARLLFVSNTHLDRGLERAGVSSKLFELAANMRLSALRPEGGARLVTSLLLGESITARDRAALARALADNCDQVPRWIHCAMAHFVKRGKPILDGDLERAMVEAVADLEREPWQLRRELAPVLDDYVQPQRGLALSILDQLALGEEQAMTFEQVARQIRMETKIDDDAIARVVGELQEDQLIEELGGQLRFCGELLRMAWLKHRFM